MLEPPPYVDEEIEEKRDLPNWVDPIINMDLSSLPSQDQSGINFGAADDTMHKHWRKGDIEVAPNIKFNRKNTEKYGEYIESVGVTGRDIETVGLETEKDMIDLKKGLRLNFPLLMSNILNVLLYRRE